MSDSDQEIAFRFAVDRVNSDRTVLPDTRLTAQIERVPQHDSFYAAKQGNRSHSGGCQLTSISAMKSFHG